MRRAGLLACSALFSISLIVQPALANAAKYTVTAPQLHGAAAAFATTPATQTLTKQQIIQLVRKKVKYVFVIYQENRSFDSYFGTYPGAEGIYSNPPASTPGYYQPIINTDGTASTVVPFLIGPSLYAEDTDDLDHSHLRLAAKLDVQPAGPALMDKFAEVEELKYSPTGNPSQKAKGYGELAMAHVDCDTIPFLWGYASNFVLFDHTFQDYTGPSTPGNLTIFASQAGETQLALHPTESAAANYASGQGEPVLNDLNPLSGSAADPIQPPNVPRNPGDKGSQLNQTYATLAITMAGNAAKRVTAGDPDAASDLADVQDDVAFEASGHSLQIPWGWYEEGYGVETQNQDQSGPVVSDGSHASYITHHNGPQYFGYVANSPKERSNLHGLTDFFAAIANQTLPKSGLFYIKGGYHNLFGLQPVNPLPAVQANFLGDDDHPAYSDAEISESMVAKVVNAIAASPYWSQSAIILTWDDSEGDYDHVPPPVLRDDQGNPVNQSSFGPRVPMIVISPYAKVHQIDSEPSSQSSVVKFVDELFSRDPLATLPDEQKGFALGQREFGNTTMGPIDTNPAIGDLMSAFDTNRLTGAAPALPASYVEIPDSTVMSLPHYNGQGCSALGIEPEDYVQGIVNVIPADFNTLPGTNPTPPPAN
jgi:phospholipase C